MRFKKFIESVSGWRRTMYVGVGSDFGSQFSIGRRNPNVDKQGANNFGFFFTDNLDVANYYARNNGVIKSAQLQVVKPIDLNTKEEFTSGEELNELVASFGVKFVFDTSEDQEVWRFIDDGGLTLRSAILAAGYDGLSFTDSLGYKVFTTYVVFHPNQIRDVQTIKMTR